MENETSRNSTDEFQNDIRRSFPIYEQVNNTANQPPQSTESGSNSSKPQEQTIKVISFPKDKAAIRIGIASIVVNAILIFFTYKLWKEAVNASNTASAALTQATNAANSAKSATDEAHIANGISDKNYAWAERSFDSNQSLNKKIFGYSNK
jgi:hypothetical protein